jgi:hypothetical protein
MISDEKKTFDPLEWPEGIAVYNFEVEGDHTYFVEDGHGARSAAIWVHNSAQGCGSQILPSGNGVRSGKRTKTNTGDAELNRSNQRENESADKLAAAGYTVEQNPPKKPNGKKPDYKIEGEYFDCYSPKGNLSTISTTVKKKVITDQADRLVLNLDDSVHTEEEIKRILKEHPVADLKQIIFVKNNTLTSWDYQ